MFLGKSRRRRKDQGPEEGAADLTPMIDIVFNLLVFFMCASKLRSVEAAIRAYLPKERGPGVAPASPELSEARIVLRPAGEGRVRVRLGEPLGEVGADPARADPAWPARHQRLCALRDLYRGPRPALPVIVDAHPDVPTQVVVLAVNEVLRAELKDITFAVPEAAY